MHSLYALEENDVTPAESGEPSDSVVSPEEIAEPVAKEGLGGSLSARPNARTTAVSIPAPRGQITDRNGQSFAQTKVVWYAAIKYPQFEKVDKEFVIQWARKRVDKANESFGGDWTVSDNALWEHYRHRRWLPMPMKHRVSDANKPSAEKKLMEGLILHPSYERYYPEGECAAHIIGYVGSQGKLEKGPINFGDPLFERIEGRSGLEKLFNDRLTGEEGMLRQDFEIDGSLVLKKYESHPKPGGTIVTTLDMEWQKYAEKVLKKYCSRGAFVVIDIHTGEVLAMASRPGFNLNDFIPFISTEKYAKLRDDPGKPLFARAFQGAYPPASTFKPIVAVTALSNRDIQANTLINCPAKIKIGNHWFRNWSKTPEGDIDVKRALARSTNPWFYKVGMKTGPTAFLSTARRLGFGSKTGLPLLGETAGLIPNHEWMKKNHGRRLMDGDTANLSIGQGVMLASPLQVAQAMAGLANGRALPKLILVKQEQNLSGKVLVSHFPEQRNYLSLDQDSVKIVHQGMTDVVHADYGTGKNASLSYTTLCGKTGTAQWGPGGLEQRLAWFSGFFPENNPRYAFAALYEGKPHEELSGGRKAAPMVRAFFENFKTEIKHNIKPAPVAMVIDEDEEEFIQIQDLAPVQITEDSPILKAVDVLAEQDAIPEKSEQYYEGLLTEDGSVKSIHEILENERIEREKQKEIREREAEEQRRLDALPRAIEIEE